MKRIYVYVAGPLNSVEPGTQRATVTWNIRRALRVAESVKAWGMVPYVPHLSHFWEAMMGEMSPEYWLSLDKDWLAKCDVMVRLSGHSLGADEEEHEAECLDIPVVYWDDGCDELPASLHALIYLALGVRHAPL